MTHPASHIAAGLGHVPESERPLVATLWGARSHGRAVARLADGTRISWRGGQWSGGGDREITFAERGE